MGVDFSDCEQLLGNFLCEVKNFESICQKVNTVSRIFRVSALSKCKQTFTNFSGFRVFENFKSLRQKVVKLNGEPHWFVKIQNVKKVSLFFRI